MSPSLSTTFVGATLALLTAPVFGQVDICTEGGWTTGTNHPAGSGSHRLLIVAVGGESDQTGTNDFTGVSYGGQTMTLLDKIETAAGGFSYVGSLWYLDEAGIAAAASTTIALTISGAFAETDVSAVTYCNVDQTDPIGSFASLQSSGGFPVDPISTSITVGAGSAGVAATGCGDLGAFTWTQDVTERTDQANSSSTWSTADAVDYATGGSKTAAADFASVVIRNVLLFAEIKALPAPVAEFSGMPLSGSSPLDLAFADLTSGVVTSWSWTFGDGGSSTLQDPAHTYTAAGTHTVSMTATGPGGMSTETKIGYITVTSPPVADFSATPTAGRAALAVDLTDLTTGAATTFSWDFGDGNSSTLQNPSHLYLSNGTYTVSLTASGPAGADTETKVNYIVVGPFPTLTDGGFESQTSGTAPATPWSITSGSGHVINPDGFASDNGMPTQRSQWAEVGAGTTNAATPPTNPGGPGLPPSGAAGICQTLTFDPGALPYLGFNAAFIVDGATASAGFNDFMSVDISDGSTTENLFYADTFSSLPNTSTKYGLPMTDVSTVVVDLSAAFPSATANTIFTLTIQVGNGGDGLNPSKGYVDRFAFFPDAATTFRNGIGINAACYVSNAPVMGSTWVATVDTTSHPGATLSAVVGLVAPLIPGIVIPAGEILVNTASGTLLYMIKPSGGGIDTFSGRIPYELGLAGFLIATQGVIFGGGAELCNAYDILSGF